MSQRRPRPRPGHALKKLASPRPCTFQSVDGGRRVCGGLLRPNRRTPLRKGRAPKPSARDAPSAVCAPIDTHSSHVCAAADRRCARTPSGDCLNRRRRRPRAGFCAGWALVGDGFSCGVGGPSWAGAHSSLNGQSALETGPPPAGAALRRPPHEGEVDYVPTRAHGVHLPLVGRSAGPWGCRVGGGGATEGKGLAGALRRRRAAGGFRLGAALGGGGDGLGVGGEVAGHLGAFARGAFK